MTRTRLMAVMVLGLTTAIAVRVTGQAPAPNAPPQQPPSQAPPVQKGHGDTPPAAQPPEGDQEPEERPRFPAHQRPPVDPQVLERGRGLYTSTCSACHGADARGGQLGGVNLLRSELVFSDQDGELIFPVVKNGRPGTIMVPLPLSEPDVKNIAAFLHSLQAAGSNQGGPPPGPPVVLNILVGDPKAGEKFFAARCSACHSPSGDLQGIATRIPDGKELQNQWVSGGRGGRRRGPAPAAEPSNRGVITATVTLASGEKVEGRLMRLDDFLVTLEQEDGTTRSFSRRGAVPAVDVHDPLTAHRALLAELTDTTMHDVTAYLATLK
jgi:cytochrome c oxidase cbb3-type subunit 3